MGTDIRGQARRQIRFVAQAGAYLAKLIGCRRRSDLKMRKEASLKACLESKMRRENHTRTTSHISKSSRTQRIRQVHLPWSIPHPSIIKNDSSSFQSRPVEEYGCTKRVTTLMVHSKSANRGRWKSCSLSRRSHLLLLVLKMNENGQSEQDRSVL